MCEDGESDRALIVGPSFAEATPQPQYALQKGDAPFDSGSKLLCLFEFPTVLVVDFFLGSLSTALWHGDDLDLRAKPFHGLSVKVSTIGGKGLRVRSKQALVSLNRGLKELVLDRTISKDLVIHDELV